MRRCKNKTNCSTPLKPASKCTDIVEKKGYCSIKCLNEHTIEKRIAAEKKKKNKQLKQDREKLKRLTQWLNDAQVVCNKYIRERDKKEPCISCGRHHNGQYDAGHYRSRGAASHLRFNEDNIHKQCQHCNNYKSGNATEYRINLIKKIGIQRVEALENNNKAHKFTIEEAKEIKQYFKDKLKKLKEADFDNG